MSNPNLPAVVRQVYALAVAIMLPAGALLLTTGWRDMALGIGCGGLVGLLNASMLVRRIERAAEAPRERAARIMSQGQTLRFGMVLLATVVVIKLDPASIPGFVLGLLAVMVLAIAAAARAVYRTCAAPSSVHTVAVPMPVAPTLDHGFDYAASGARSAVSLTAVPERTRLP